MGNPPIQNGDSADLQDTWLTPWQVFLGFVSPTLDKTEIEVYAHYEDRPDVMRPIQTTVFKLQAPLYQNLHWVIHKDGQLRGYASDSKGIPTRQRLTKEQKTLIVFPPHIKEVITGLILSDASLKKDQRTPNSNAALKI
jgi:hypothetical protein